MNLFNRDAIYEMIFFNIQSSTEHKNIEDFEKNDPLKFNTWKNLAIKRYTEELKSLTNLNDDEKLNQLYLEKASFLPELSKIIHITYALPERGDTDELISRKLIDIKEDDELILIKNFSTILNEQYVIGNQQKPKYIPILCGHNIMGHDIPLLIKRMLKYRNDLKIGKQSYIIPLPIRHYLNCKPWESNVLDTVQSWKFNGSDYISMSMIADFLSLKKSKNFDFMTMDEVTKLYWSEDDDKTNKIRLQSANYTNLAFQLVKELRIL